METSSQDGFVGIVALCLGLVLLWMSATGGRGLAKTPLAQGMARIGGNRLVVIVYGATGLLMLFIANSLLRK